MNLPFTTAQFFDVFEKYNTQVWPMQVVLYALALLVVLFAWRHRQASARSVMAILAGLWLWMGIVYHFMFFAAINPAANVFGTIFVIQGFILLYAGIIQPKLSFRIRMTLTGGTGLVFIAYALLIYPLIGMVFGHMFPRAPIFGLPCPTTIFTFGVLLFANERVPWYLFVIPLLWSLVGFSAAWTLGVIQDYGLLVAGVLGSALLLLNNRNEMSTKPD